MEGSPRGWLRPTYKGAKKGDTRRGSNPPYADVCVRAGVRHPTCMRSPWRRGLSLARSPRNHFGWSAGQGESKRVVEREGDAKFSEQYIFFFFLRGKDRLGKIRRISNGTLTVNR